MLEGQEAGGAFRTAEQLRGRLRQDMLQEEWLKCDLYRKEVGWIVTVLWLGERTTRQF